MRISLFLVLALMACANPKYVSESPASVPAQRQPPGGDEADAPGKKPDSVCEIRFAGGACVNFAWEKFPTEEDYGSFLFEIKVDGVPVDLGLVEVVLWMPSMGHGSSPVTVERTGVGTYRASEVFFTMRGEWDVRWQIKVGSEVRDRATARVHF